MLDSKITKIMKKAGTPEKLLKGVHTLGYKQGVLHARLHQGPALLTAAAIGFVVGAFTAYDKMTDEDEKILPKIKKAISNKIEEMTNDEEVNEMLGLEENSEDTKDEVNTEGVVGEA